MGIPNLVKPELTKIDLSRLKQDYIKYNSAGVLTPDANTWWQNFLDDFEENYASIPVTNPVWYLDRLKVIRETTQVHHNPPLAPNVPENTP